MNLTRPLGHLRLSLNPSQVKKAIHAKIAEIVAWSLKVSARGVGPDTGFEGEVFKEGTPRYRLRGKQLAMGWKNLALETLLFC